MITTHGLRNDALTIEQAAELLRVEPADVRTAVREGELQLAGDASAVLIDAAALWRRLDPLAASSEPVEAAS
jgi:hypothetical protein